MNSSVRRKINSLLDQDDFKNGEFVYRSKKDTMAKKEIIKVPKGDPNELKVKPTKNGKVRSVVKDITIDEIQEEQDIIYIRSRN